MYSLIKILYKLFSFLSYIILFIEEKETGGEDIILFFEEKKDIILFFEEKETGKKVCSMI